MITVYGKPNCVQCDRTTKVLNLLGKDYTYIDVTTDKEAYTHITEDLGYMQAPVVVAGDKHWSGFRPDLLDTLAN